MHGLSKQQNLFLMISQKNRYDFAHFEFIMRGLARLQERYPSQQDSISLSLHCEIADILNAYTKIVQQDTSLTGLSAYSAARPPHSEGLAICIASYLAHETNCGNINLRHLSSRKAVEAALMMQSTFPHINFRREVTVGHLLLDVDAPTGKWAKVIGGTEYLLSGILSEGRKRGMSYNQMAKLLCWNPAQRFGLPQKGDIAVGYDADLVLVDPNETFVVRASDSESQQGYTPFAGMELRGRVQSTFLRGQLIYDRHQIVGLPRGRYLRRSQP